MLLSLGSTPELAEKREHNWWSDFVREMEAIGCINIRQNDDGEWEFDCPAMNLAKAKKIVAKYKARE